MALASVTGVRVGVTPRRYPATHGRSDSPTRCRRARSRRSRSARSRSGSPISTASRSRRRPSASKGTLVHRALELLMCRPADDRTVDAALADLDRARAELADRPRVHRARAHPRRSGQVRPRRRGARPAVLRARGPVDRQPDRARAEARRPISATVRVRGIIDRLELDADGELVVTDYKTGRVPASASSRRASAACTSTRCCASRCSAGGRRACSSSTCRSPRPSSRRPRSSRVAACNARRRAVVGDRARVRARRLPAEPGPSVRLLLVQAVLPGVRRRSRAGRRAAGPGHRDRARAPARDRLRTLPAAATRCRQVAVHVEERGRRARLRRR